MANLREGQVEKLVKSRKMSHFPMFPEEMFLSCPKNIRALLVSYFQPKAP